MTKDLSRETHNLLTAASVFAQAFLPESHYVLGCFRELHSFLSRPRVEVTARDVEMLRAAAAMLDGSHPFDAQTVAATAPGLADELRGIARAHCPHVRIADGVCRHCDAPQDFEAGGRDVPMVGSSPRENVQHPAGFGPTSSPARGDQ